MGRKIHKRVLATIIAEKNASAAVPDSEKPPVPLVPVVEKPAVKKPVAKKPASKKKAKARKRA